MEDLQPFVRGPGEDGDEVDLGRECAECAPSASLLEQGGSTHIMKGKIPMAIHPLRVAMGML